MAAVRLVRRVAAPLSRGGPQLKSLEDGSILSTGPTPVKDTYDIMVLPGKRRITGLRLELALNHHNTTVRVNTTRLPFFDPSRKKACVRRP